MLIAEVIIPLAVEGSFSYELPPDLHASYPEVGAGCRVAVPFGAKRYYTGVIRRLREEDEGRRCKPIDQVLDASPLISEEQLRLWDSRLCDDRAS